MLPRRGVLLLYEERRGRIPGGVCNRGATTNRSKRTSASLAKLREQGVLDLRPGNDGVGQGIGPAIMREGQPLVIQPERVQQRGVEIVDTNDIRDRFASEFIGAAV